MADAAKSEVLERLDSRLQVLRDDIYANRRIVVVDDEPVIGMVMEDLLTPDGYEVRVAASVVEARDVIKEHDPIIVLLDKNLPGESGLVLLSELTETENAPAVVIMTGYASYDSVIEAIHSGAFAYLTKPFKSLNEVRAKVKSALRRKRRERLNKEFVEELRRLLNAYLGESKADENTALLVSELQLKLKRFEDKHLVSKRVLLADPDDDMAGLFDKLQDEMGFELQRCVDGDQALVKLETEPCNLLVVEADLPSVSGIKVIEHACKMQPEISIVVQTAVSTMESALEAMEKGANEFVHKPIENLDIYKQVIGKSLESARKNLRFRVLIKEMRELFAGLYPERFQEILISAERAGSQAALAEVMEESDDFEDMIIKTGPTPRQTGANDGESRTTKPGTADARSAKVLLIDDEPVVLMVLEELLGEMGLTVFSAGSGVEGLEIFGRERPDLCIVDKNLPGKSGLEIMAMIRAQAPDVGLIMITGYSSLEAATTAQQLGVSDYIRKPFRDIRQIRATVTKTLEKQREWKSTLKEIAELEEEKSVLRDRLRKLEKGS